METRKLGTMDLDLPVLSFAASPIGEEFGKIDHIDDAPASVPALL